MAVADLRIPPREGYIDAAYLIDLKAFADLFDAPEGVEERAESISRQSEHFDVDVLRFAAEQAVAGPAADDERAAAGVADGRRDGLRVGEPIRGRQACAPTS